MATGHIRPRGQSLEVRVHIGGGRYETRTVRWQGTKTETRKAAERELRKLLDEHDSGTSGADKTVAQLCARWRKNAVADWSPRTRETYDAYVRLHVLPTLGKKKLHEVRPSDLDDLYTELRRPPKNLSPASVRKVHVIIRRAFADAVRWRWVATNPASDARPPAVKTPDLKPPSVAEVRMLIDRAAVCDPDFAIYLAVASDTGARRGEVCGLRWTDIDFDLGELVISRSVAIDKGGILVKDTKTHQARRIALGAPLVALLAEHHARVTERAQAMGVELPVNAYVFSTPHDFTKPWNPGSTTARFTRLRNNCGCEKPYGKAIDRCDEPAHQWAYGIRLHDLRHAMITDWLVAGVDTRTVMGRVGHASLQTLTRYAHFVAAADRDAADRLGDRLTR